MARRSSLGDLIDAGLVDEAMRHDCTVVVHVIAAKVFKLYASMVARRMLGTARLLAICFSAVLVAWMLSHFA